MGDDDMIRRGDALKIALAYASGEGGALAEHAIRAIPAADARADALPRSANRVTYDDKGRLDEIVTDAGVHLEDLGGNRWFLGALRSDGTEVRVWFQGKVTMIEDDAPETKP